MKRRHILTSTITMLILVLMVTVQGSALPGDEPLSLVRAEEASAPSAPQDTPVTLVAERVTRYDIAAPKLFWYEWSQCITPPTAAPTTAPTAYDYAETIRRIATYGGLVRTLYDEEVVYPTCQDDFLSNIVADANYVYWMSHGYGGVVRLSTSANVGDAPELLSDAVSGNAELAEYGDYVYAMSTTGSGIWRVNKTSGAANKIVISPGDPPRNLQTDGKYVYWIDGTTLKRKVPVVGVLSLNVATGVSGYYPEGSQFRFCYPPPCENTTEYVFIGQGNQVVRYNNVDLTTSTIYTSADASASIHTLVSEYGGMFGPSRLFFVESREVSCDMFCTYDNRLVRTGRGGGAADTLYVTDTGMATIMRIADYLQASGDFVFWQESGALKRLPQDAAALPMTNMRVTGLEITQGIQDLDNSVRLIKDRRTFVRVYVQSDGPAVPGVTAYLYRTNSGGEAISGPLTPINSVGQQITVQPYSIFWRLSLDHSFLFELPWDWTADTLYLYAVLNPNRVPPQASYENNTLRDGPFTFETSPRLQVQFVSFGYQLGNQIYYPRLIDDVFQTYSWIRRTYPLASTPGSASDPSPGFRPNLWIIADEALGSHVDQSAPVCAQLYPDPKYRNLCASAYTNGVLNVLRSENGVPGNVFMYGMISDAAGIFPRGQAGGGNVSSGPAGSGTWGWDNDGTYADWYAGHEIGHTLARSHPYKGSSEDSNVCGQSPNDGALDQSYPYADGRLSWGSESFWGFDTGDAAFDLPVQLYPGVLWFDVMTYCPYQWISDYTYDGMYSYMHAHPSARVMVNSVAPRVSGDFLSVAGSIAPDDDVAVFHRLRRLDSVASIPELGAGDDDYRIRLLDGTGGALTDYGFIPEVADNAPLLSFAQVVTFTAGTAQVQIVKGVDDQVLASQNISANSPTVSDVALQSAPSPVTGTVTLAWNGDDTDGDDLAFDVFYSADGGATFQPLQMNMTESSARASRALLQSYSAAIDTTPLGGSSSAALRVVASDGVNTGYGDTDPFTMADKPPQPRILLPADGTQAHYDQLVNFVGEALDPQDGSVFGAGLVWGSQDGELGTGPLLSLSNLPVGTNYITLTATNSAALSATATITVVVDDDLDLPGPTLSVAPTSVGWHVALGTTEAQTTSVGIYNAGSGSLGWSASEDADWLATSAIMGTAPYTLTLTADPTGLKDGTVLTTTLWITSPASTEHVTETVAIPVGLSVGDVYRIYPEGPSTLIYLPLVLRNYGP
jgi:hypothetical protein